MIRSKSADHDRHVVAQFGPRARAYVESADHARGTDLDRLSAIAAARPGCQVLDLGCGGGHVAYAVAPFAGEVVAYDLSREMLTAVQVEAARRGFTNVRTEQGSVESLPFPPASFDLVLTRFSAHHWLDVPTALAEMRRVVRPGGLVVVMDTIAPEAASLDAFLNAVEVLRDPSHVRDRTVSEWRDALVAVGLHPSAPVLSRLRLAFDAWIARLGTPEDNARAIRDHEAVAGPEIAAHFALEPDGSFTIDTMMLEAAA